MRETYFKIKEKCELPVANLHYTYRDFEGNIHPFSCITVDLKEDDKNIKMMENIKKKYGPFFMFFNNDEKSIYLWNTIIKKINLNELYNLEIINISNKNDNLVALLSYQDISKTDLNNGYNTVDIPINLIEKNQFNDDLEIIDLSNKYGKIVALLSFKNTNNNSFDVIEIPVNLRDIQYSVRGNILVDQSVKNYYDVKNNDN